MENKLVARSLSEYEQRLSQAVDEHRRTFVTQTETFNSTTQHSYINHIISHIITFCVQNFKKLAP